MNARAFRRIGGAIGVALVLGVASVYAQTDASAAAPAEEVTLDRLIDTALARSPGLQAKKRAYEAARSRVIAAWLPEDPMVGVDVEGQSSLFNFGSRTDREYMVSQTIPFPTTLLLRGQVAAREARMAYQQYKEAERDTIWHIEQPYYDLYMNKKTILALEDVEALLDKLSRAVQARYETNQASQQDVLKVQIELSKVRIDLFNARQQEHVAQAHFSHILDRSLETSYAIPDDMPLTPLSLTRPDLERLALKTKPELLAMETDIRRAKANRLMAFTNWLPEVTGRLEGRQFRGESGLREKDTFIGITVPVWSLLKGVGGTWTSAQREVQQAEAQYLEMKNEVLLAVHESYASAASAQHGLLQYEQVILPQARQQVDVAFAAYEAGRTDFLNLIDAQRMLKDAQMAYYKLKAGYERGLSNLRLAVGSALPTSQGGAK
ncbi:MAG: TolC family protein [Candidatus Omnitrophota bacterium]|nr:TolC family protein [Candidatus Omnitrophota bacterium]